MSRKNQMKEIVCKHIEEWKRVTGASRETVAIALVEAIDDLDMWNVLESMDITFRSSGDAFAVAKTNSQKFFRWLGVIDNGDHENGGHVFELLPAILRAMPADIRSRCTNDLLSGVGLFVASAEEGHGDSLDSVHSQIIKEVSEAQLAIQGLKSDATQSESAIREVGEAVAALQNAVDVIKKLSTKAQIQAVK